MGSRFGRILMTAATLAVLVQRSSAMGAPLRVDDVGEWELVRGGFGDVIDIATVGANETWAVSSRDIVRYDGVNWRTSIPDVYPTSISMAPDGTGWVGTIVGPWRFDGSAWHSYVSPPGRYIADVAAIRNGSAWALALANRLLPSEVHLVKFDPHGNESASFTLEGQYQSLSAVAENDVWVVGASGIAHFDGVGLERYPLDVPDALVDVTFAGADRGWAVGGSCLRGVALSRVVATFRGGRWEVSHHSAQPPFWRVAALPSGAVLAGDYRAQVFSLDRGVPELEFVLPGNGARCDGGITAMATSMESDRILLGALAGGLGGDPMVYSYSDEGLAQLHGFIFRRLAIAGEASGWALAEHLMEFARGRWTVIEDPVGTPEVIRDLRRSSRGTLRVAGRHQSEAVVAEMIDGQWQSYSLGVEGSAIRSGESEDGTIWVGVNRPSEESGEALVMVSGGSLSGWVEDWATAGDFLLDMDVGRGGHVLALMVSGDTFERTPDGWRTIPDACGVPFTAVAATETSGWAVGDGSICVLTADGWVQDDRLDEAARRHLEHVDFGGIIALNEDEAWAVGSEGNVLRFHDGEWRFDHMSGRLDGSFDERGKQQLRAIDVRQPDAEEAGWIWVAGDADTVYRRMIPNSVGTAEPTASPTRRGVQATATPRPAGDGRSLFLPLVDRN